MGDEHYEPESGAPMTRRRCLHLLGAAAMGGVLAGPGVAPAMEASMRTRKIPRTGEEIPVVGLGTWQTFDVGPNPSERAPLAEVLRRFFAAGGRVIDSSPMYGRSEAVAGDLVSAGKHPAFLATKVWTTGKREGIEQMTESMRLLRTARLDLMQVHNLVDWKTHLPVMRSWRTEGRLRYLGITHYALSSFDEIEGLLRREKLDFVQLPYSVGVRAAASRLLPAAADNGTAVLVMRPFEEGELFRRVAGKPLPPWAAERGFASWSELFLGFILAHPAVTCVLPATSNPDHLAQNVRAGWAPELDPIACKQLTALVEATP